jgi:glycolate oxidase iron-sulfur subunit
MKTITPPLGLDPDELATCVACGLCLPHCPTWRVTGEEALSPRGRIAAMREVEGGLAVDADVLRSVDTCVQCRGCEPACPSGVPFGHLMEDTRAALVGRIPRWQRLGHRVLGRHRLLLALSTVGALLQRAHLLPSRRLGLARLPLRRPALRASGDDVVLFTGCVMDAWMRPTHVAAQRVIETTGAGVALPGAGAACCGALHVHAGLVDQARALARRTIAALPGDAPVLVDSAGCGAALKDYGRLLGTAEAERFSARVLDVHEWLAARIDDLPPPQRSAGTVAIQDPCHLRHVQRAHEPVRALLSRYAEVVELDDEGLCCGAGGAYSLTQPDLARDIRDRKLAAIARSGASVVASANPGCAMHLAAAGVHVRHPVEIIEEALHDGR